MNLARFSRLFQLPVSLGMNLLLTASEHVLRRDVANGTVQEDVFAMLDVSLTIWTRKRGQWACW
jgi:hypothetical protein